MNWTTLGLIVATAAPLVGVPLGVIALYLKSLRDYHINRSNEMTQRVGHLDEALDSVTRQVRDMERDYTTKEEWLRESMYARRQLEKLTEMVMRIEAQLENGNGLAHHFAQATQAMVRLCEAYLARREEVREA
jgi:hypothetical protein